MQSNQIIRCTFCNDEHRVPKDGFMTDKKTANIIELELHHIDLGDKHLKAIESCKKLDETIQQLYYIIHEPDSYLNEIFNKLINQTDIRREEYKLVIEEWYDNCIFAIQNHKKECITIFKKDFESQIELIQIAKIQLDLWKQKLEIPELSKNEFSFEKIDENANSLCMIINKSIDILKSDILLNTEYKLDDKRNMPIDFLGQISDKKKVLV